MRITITLLLAAALFLLGGCQQTNKQASERQTAPASATSKDASKPSASQSKTDQEKSLSHAIVAKLGGQETQVSLEGAAAVQAATLASDRKIIRNAEITIETDSPTDNLRKITSIAEAQGGFVVTSEFKQNDGGPQIKPTQTVTIVARVPSSQFSEALAQIRAVGGRVVQEKVSGQDVSEEYLDLDARIRSKKALEAQFLEIMKQAKKVSDALEVQSQLADVRTEIERLEGRRRFLENQSALSTITATLQMPAPLVAATTTGFGYSIKQAFGDAVDTAASIILFVIQAVIVLIPVALLVVLPVWFVWRVLRRRFVSSKKTEAMAESH